MSQLPPLPEGIHLRSNSLVIDFRYRGQRCRETLKNLAPTKSNIRFAERKRSAILLEITQGSFDYSHHFPDSRNATKFSDNAAQFKTISTALDEWLAIAKTNVTPNTYRGYAGAVENYVRPAFGSLTLGQLTRTKIQHWIASDLSKLQSSGINAKLVPLKGIIKNAIADRVLTHDPLVDVRPPQTDYVEPDPLTLAEIDALLGVASTRTSEMNMVKFALWSGLRPGELVALAWEDIDWVHGTVSVRRSLSRDGYKVPKTRRSVRKVELLTPAREALEAQRALTELRPLETVATCQRDNRQLRTEHIRFVFISSVKNAAFNSVENYRRYFWDELLRKAKVRGRGCKTTRHTFISQMLTSGMPKEWIMRQVGHASMSTIDNHYGKWIREDALNMASIADEKFGFGHKRVTKIATDAKNR